jgi:hypothetical protein
VYPVNMKANNRTMILIWTVYPNSGFMAAPKTQQCEAQLTFLTR